jgi:uncharacterized protein (TIGR03790 family)
MSVSGFAKGGIGIGRSSARTASFGCRGFTSGAMFKTTGMITVSVLALVLAGCSGASSAPASGPPGVPFEQAPAESRRVLVVINQASKDSIDIGRYYANKRQIPRENVVLVTAGAGEEIARAEFQKNVLEPVKAAIGKLKGPVDFLVTTKGIPIRFSDYGGYSTDAHLGAMNLDIKPIEKPDPEDVKRSMNPYFSKREPFSSKKFNFYLVTRLDGYSAADAKALVDRSLSAKKEFGPFFFDAAGNRKDGGYGEMQKTLYAAKELLAEKGFEAVLDTSEEFLCWKDELSGYASWGSNDSKFDVAKYKGLRFKPGALAETFVSTSGRTFNRTEGGQSLIADLIESGVTGVKGYVHEPYTFALARPEILFERYTSGFNLAESFYMASLVLKWKDVVIGDPLCRPYK